MGTYNYETWTHTKEQLETYSDQVKVVVVAKMIREGILSDEDGDEWAKTHTVILRKPSTIKRIFNNLIGKKDENHIIVVAKVDVHHDENPEDEESDTKGTLIPIDGGKNKDDDKE